MLLSSVREGRAEARAEAISRGAAALGTTARGAAAPAKVSAKAAARRLVGSAAAPFLAEKVLRWFLWAGTHGRGAHFVGKADMDTMLVEARLREHLRSLDSSVYARSGIPTRGLGSHSTRSMLSALCLPHAGSALTSPTCMSPYVWEGVGWLDSSSTCPTTTAGEA